MTERLQARSGRLTFVVLLAILGVITTAQDAPLEYPVKAAYLYNFVKYVEWPDGGDGTILICVAGQNPFGTQLDALVKNERVRGKTLAAETILEPKPECDVLFIPKTSTMMAYLKASAGKPVLTVGEIPRFVELGGIVNFVTDNSNRVRFEINRNAADRVGLRISSRLLQLATIVDPAGESR